ncbi:MAG: DUF305 domain-containing protein [Candidatus Gracilibacteria bacterium]
MKKLISLSTLSFLLLLSGCGTQSISENVSHSSGSSMSSGAAMHDMTSMMQAASDEEFIAKMIPHHEEAVISSKNLLETSKNEKLRVIAQRIVDAQEKEIAEMKEWSNTWFGKDVTDHNQYMQMMPKLTDLSPAALDKAYMTGMIIHHEGAIEMAYDLMKYTKRPELQKMARDIVLTQQKEVAEFKALLKE